MLKSTKIQSYTISEILVVLVISAILIGITFNVLGLVQKQMHALRTNFQIQTEISKLNLFLSNNINTFPQTEYDKLNDKINFIKARDTLSFDLGEKYFEINENKINVKLVKDNLYLNGRNVDEGFIDAMKIKIELPQDQQTYIFVDKLSDASTLIQQ